MSRDTVKTLQVQEQGFRQMGNPAMANSLDTAAKEITSLRNKIAPIAAWWAKEKSVNPSYKSEEIILGTDGNETVTAQQLDTLLEGTNEPRQK